MIRWKNKPNGFCPVQADGYFMGHYFYFRSRWSTATIEFSKKEEDWNENNLIRSYVLTITPGFEAGWISHTKCKWLIYKGFLMFLLRVKSTHRYK